MISLPVRQILSKAALASIPANRQGLGSRVKIIRGGRPVGMGFLPYESGDEEYYGQYDPYYDSYDRYDESYGYGGDWASPPDDHDYSTPGISPYSWSGSDGSANDDPGFWDWLTGGGGSNDGGYLDEFGSYMDAQGNEWWFNQNTGEYDMLGGDGGTIYSTTDEYVTPTDYSAINDTLDWWGSIANGQTDVSDSDLNAIINDSGLHSLGGEYSGVTVPAPTAPRADKLAWLKKMAEQAKKALASKAAASGASSGSASAAKPVAPKADGTCPAGYVKNAGGQCVKSPTTATANNSLAGILNNPLYLALGAIGLILLAKK